MKMKTTKKSMKESYDKILKIGYCDAQYLLQFEEPTAYSTRAEGWACDYYDIDGTLISTGYSPIGESVDYKTVKEYDEKAREIIRNDEVYEDKKIKVNELLKEFISKF